jgi:pimeloyl-ACP methyl ester carboxylesterase
MESIVVKKGKLKRFWMLFGVLAFIIVAGSSFLAIGSVVAEAKRSAGFAQRHPAPGQLIRVNQGVMHIYCLGQGSPTVILDTDIGAWSASAAGIQESMAENRRVCVYDRAGYGWSERTDSERTVQQAAYELHTLLRNTRIDEEYVLVGQGYSGLIARVYAAAYPEETAAIVLIDPADPWQERGETGISGLFMASAKTGLLHLAGTEFLAAENRWLVPGVTGKFGTAYYDFAAGAGYWTSIERESRALDKSFEFVRDRPDPQPAVPSRTVLSYSPGQKKDGEEALIEGISEMPVGLMNNDPQGAAEMIGAIIDEITSSR